jgi:hypothetical protein
MPQLLCLVTLVVGCSTFGYILASLVFASRDGAGFTEAWQLLGAIAGAYLGIVIELTWRAIIRRKRRFSLGELLAATTLLATLLVVIEAVRSAYQGR